MQEYGLEVHIPHPRQFEKALYAFKRKVDTSGLLGEVRHRRFFRSASKIRKQAKAAKRVKSLKNSG